MNIPAFSVSTNIPLPTTIIKNEKPHHRPQKSKLSPKPLSKSSHLDESLNLIRTNEAQPHPISSYATFLSDCIAQKSTLHGQQLYLHLLLNHPTTILHHPIILSKLITLFSTSPDQLHEAGLVLDHALQTTNLGVDQSVWSALLLGYLRNGYPERALVLYSRMLAHRLQLSSFTISLIVKAFNGVQDLRFGRSVHAQIVKSEKEQDGAIYDALLALYNGLASFGEVYKVFVSMPSRDMATWNIMLDRFLEKGMVLEAFAAFRRMIREGILFDWNSLFTVLGRCSRYMILLNVVKEIHARMLKSDEEADIDALNVLLDMYANCGEMGYCMRVFDAMEVKDSTSWNNVLNGYAINGCMRELAELFQEMLKCGIRPDRLTFSALLTGCIHSGLIEEGQVLFDRMRNEFQIEPHLEHYGCLVDLYGKRGRIEEALEMVKLMPEEPSDYIYGSLLNSCRLHGNVSLAQEIFEQILLVGPNNFNNYITMSNIYADAGMWEGVNRVRGIMEKSRIQLAAMCSWIQIKDQVYMFMDGGSFKFCNSSEFKTLWDDLNEGPDREYMFDSSIDNVKAEWACGHSERVAIVFALIHCAPGVPIRIAKNYLVCKACHSWMKNISQVTKRKIILRDTDQFHHFYEGQCRCNEYCCTGQ